MEIVTLLELVSWVYVGIVVLGLELLKKIAPFIERGNSIWVTLIFSAIVGVLLYFLDGSILFGTLFLSFLMSVVLYDVFVKQLKKVTGW